MDYCYMGKEDRKALTIIVLKDRESKAMKALCYAFTMGTCGRTSFPNLAMQRCDP